MAREGRSVQEIAAAVGASEKNVRNLIGRLRKAGRLPPRTGASDAT